MSRKIKRGRPLKTVFINVEVRAKTRDALWAIKRESGLRQGEILDRLIADAMLAERAK